MALREENEHWVQLASAGLICSFGLQAIINLGVNLNLIPSKGMTLPFISVWRLIAARIGHHYGHACRLDASTRHGSSQHARASCRRFANRKWSTPMSGVDKIFLAAGGTGGHMFLAGALAEQLKDAGYDVHLATDKRGMAYVSNLTPMELHQLPAATVYGGGFIDVAFANYHIAVGSSCFINSHFRLRPKVIIGFGGYPSFGPIIAGHFTPSFRLCMSKMPYWVGSINWLPISVPMLRPVLRTPPICWLRQFKNCAAPAIRFVPPFCARPKAVIVIWRRPAPLRC